MAARIKASALKIPSRTRVRRRVEIESSTSCCMVWTSKDGLVFINRGDGGANRGGEAGGIHGGADNQVHVSAGVLAVGRINFQARGVVQAVELGVCNDADDGDPFFVFAGMAPQEAFADGIVVGPKAAGHGGVDERDVRCGFVVSIGEVTAAEKWDAHGGDVGGADVVTVGMREFAGAGSRKAFNGDV